mmetsp:Transcript_98773/g.185585  ORF Transcript_98773/g.185585 Transcript_98773/m.185585 type:complete len:114 (+) Transcript_98773:1513-1854(+)
MQMLTHDSFIIQKLPQQCTLYEIARGSFNFKADSSVVKGMKPSNRTYEDGGARNKGFVPFMKKEQRAGWARCVHNVIQDVNIQEEKEKIPQIVTKVCQHILNRATPNTGDAGY